MDNYQIKFCNLTSLPVMHNHYRKSKVNSTFKQSLNDTLPFHLAGNHHYSILPLEGKYHHHSSLFTPTKKDVGSFISTLPPSLSLSYSDKSIQILNYKNRNSPIQLFQQCSNQCTFFLSTGSQNPTK